MGFLECFGWMGGWWGMRWEGMDGAVGEGGLDW